MSSQFDSLSDKVDYDTKTHVLVLAVNYLVNEKLNLSFANTYADSQAKMGHIGFSSNDIPNYDFDLYSIDEYSDLNIQQIDFTTEANYQINENFSLNLGFSYQWYDDDEPYIDDGTGEAFIGNIGISYYF